MIDIVYVVRADDTNEELRYSLRSLSNLPHRRVWIAGYKPRWVDNVEHLPTIQTKTKYQNSTANLLTACLHPDITDHFVYMNDDFFVINKTETVPPLHRGPVDNVIDYYQNKYRHKSTPGVYVDGMIATRDLLNQWGINHVMSYELHLPMTINRKLMVSTLRRASEEAPSIVALHKRTLYGNANNIGGRQIDDVKVLGLADSISRDQLFASTSNLAFKHGPAGSRIRKLFPHPSRYEKR
jgi:hypothetical protein